jgi:heme/copper-type cytochrome/quinol oxidase subunit 2
MSEEEKNPHLQEEQRLKNSIFLWTMFIAGICIPLILIILKITVWKSLWIIAIVFSVIVLPIGIIFVLNGLRLNKKEGDQIENN